MKQKLRGENGEKMRRFWVINLKFYSSLKITNLNKENNWPFKANNKKKLKRDLKGKEKCKLGL